jgi:hypothetical protein
MQRGRERGCVEEKRVHGNRRPPAKWTRMGDGRSARNSQGKRNSEKGMTTRLALSGGSQTAAPDKTQQTGIRGERREPARSVMNSVLMCRAPKYSPSKSEHGRRPTFLAQYCPSHGGHFLYMPPLMPQLCPSAAYPPFGSPAEYGSY